MTKPVRKQRIAELRDEGYEAFRSGSPLARNPYGVIDGTHWSDGWHAAQKELRLDKAGQIESDGQMLRFSLATAIHEYTSGPTEFAMSRLLRTLEEWEDHIVKRTIGELHGY